LISFEEIIYSSFLSSYIFSSDHPFSEALLCVILGRGIWLESGENWSDRPFYDELIFAPAGSSLHLLL